MTFKDSGKSFLSSNDQKVTIDLNRSGVGLIEIVSEPDLISPRETSIFVQTIHHLLQDLQVCSGSLEQGAMRVDVNVNLIDEETGERVTPIVELKNINAINGIESAVTSEISRQQDQINSGNSLELNPETRIYSSVSNETILLRSKDSSESYKYLPEYDLPVYNLNVSDYLADIPKTRHQIIQDQLVLYPDLSKDLLLRLRSSNIKLANLFDQTVSLVYDRRFLLNWCLGEFLAILNRENIDSIQFTPKSFAELVENVAKGSLDKELAKSEMNCALKSSRDLNLLSITPENDILNDQEINNEIDNLLNKHPERVSFLKSLEGQRRGSIDFFIGPLMKQFRGRIDVKDLAIRIKSRLNPKVIE